MRAHRIETVLKDDAVLQLKDLPFKSGQRVEVIVLEQSIEPQSQRWQQLRGSVLRYDEPTEPVGQEDWEALK